MNQMHLVLNREQQEARKRETEKYIQVLIHSIYCLNFACPEDGCLEMKALLLHVQLCKTTSSVIKCERCKKYYQKVYYHSKDCTHSLCIVRYCMEIKQSARKKLVLEE